MQRRNLNDIDEEIKSLTTKKDNQNLEFTRNLNKLPLLSKEFTKQLNALNKKYDYILGEYPSESRAINNIQAMLDKEEPDPYVKQTFISEDVWKKNERENYYHNLQSYRERMNGPNLSYYDASEQPPEEPDTSSQAYQIQKNDFDYYENKKFKEQQDKISIIAEMKKNSVEIKQELEKLSEIEKKREPLHNLNKNKDINENIINNSIKELKLERKMFISKEMINYLATVVNLNQAHWKDKGKGKSSRLKMPERIAEWIKILNDNKTYPTELEKFKKIQEICVAKLKEDSAREEAKQESGDFFGYVGTFFDPNAYKNTDPEVAKLTKLIAEVDLDRITPSQFKDLTNKMQNEKYGSDASVIINTTPKLTRTNSDDNL